jgi:D-alanine-D-alanine ligase
MRAEITDAQQETLAKVSKQIFKILELSGYGRVDFRLGADGKFYFLEANPNPEIASREEYAASARAVGIEYPELLQRILNLGLRRRLGG